MQKLESMKKKSTLQLLEFFFGRFISWTSRRTVCLSPVKCISNAVYNFIFQHRIIHPLPYRWNPIGRQLIATANLLFLSPGSFIRFQDPTAKCFLFCELRLGHMRPVISVEHPASAGVQQYWKHTGRATPVSPHWLQASLKLWRAQWPVTPHLSAHLSGGDHCCMVVC